MRKKSLFGLCLILSVAAVFPFGWAGQNQDFDVLIINGKIIDGTGNPWFYGDLGIVGDTIVEIGELKGRSADKIINARGKAVSPGFIDMHTHCDRGLGRVPTNANLNYLTQGVTTVVTGNCGSGTFRIARTKAAWEKKGIGSNAVLLVGFGTIRRKVMGDKDRVPTAEELAEMKALMKQAMDEGAWGLSTGLQYIPDRYATTEEVIAITQIVRDYGGIYTSHQRNEEEHLVEAVEETIRIGRETGVRVNSAHFKCAGKNNWGIMKDAVKEINKARAEGIYITADLYPWDKAATTPLLAIFNVPHDWKDFKDLEKKIMFAKSEEERAALMQKAIDGLAEALADKDKREAIRKLTIEGDPEKVNWVKTWGWHNFTIVDAKKNKHLIGKLISDLAEQQKKDPFDIAADLFIKEKLGVIISLCTMSEDDIKHAMQQDWLMISSDGSAVPFGEGPVHPRNYGSFTRVLRKYVREENTVALEQAVRKMSSLPAYLLQLKDRGLILEGYKADVVIFDPDTVRDNATYIDNHKYSTGIDCVLVNGKVTIENGKHTKTLNGRVLLLSENK